MAERVEKVRLTSRNREGVRALYTAAFQKKDRMPFSLMCLMACLPNTEFLCFYEGDTLCGFVYLAKMGNMVFLMFLAVDEKLRSRGLGSRILAHVGRMYPGKKLVVSFERCGVAAADLEERRRRRKFYLENGYGASGYLIRLGAAEQELAVKNGEIRRWELRWFFLVYSCFTLWPRIWREDG